MKQRFRAITQVSLAGLLALTLGLVAAVPSIAQESAQESASVSPSTEVYDLDNSPDFIKTSIIWGPAGMITGITAGADQMRLVKDDDYIVLVNTLLILTDYLEDKLNEDEDKLQLAIEFDVGESASFTIEAVETYPRLPENPYAYDLFSRADVEIIITWNWATAVVSIMDDDEYSLQEGPRGDYTVSENTLTILSRYLEGKLTEEGSTLALTIGFDRGDPITKLFEAVNMAPSIAPERADYDLDDPAAVNTIITWDDAANVTSIVDDEGELEEESDYSVTAIDADRATLTILNDYLSEKLKDIDQSVELSIRFGFNSTIHPGLQHDATFNITAIGTHPTISPGVAPYDLRSPAAVNTTITWRAAERSVSVADDGYQLQLGDDYTVTTIDADRATLTVLNSYLADNLRAVGDSLALAIGFSVGDPAAFTITAVNASPSIDPRGVDYNLDTHGDVETIITWQVPTQVVSITENGDPLIMREDYEVIVEGEGDRATLTILSDQYLNRRLRDVGDEAVLTIEFSVGDPLTFTITAIRYPAVDPMPDPYDLDNRADFIETSITWGSASNIDRIADDKRDLTPGVNNDYIVLGDTLIITDNYLRGLDIGDDPVLSIDFDDDYTADFLIRVIGTDAEIEPTRVVYDLDDPADVQTTITWGSATDVLSITETENDNPLIRGIPGGDYGDYVVGQTVDGNATLTISKAYLREKLERWVDEIPLTVDFDVGKDATLWVAGLARCFVATAAYGTPMAEQIQILREFRDEYLVTNSLGQGLVDIYYSISPSTAQFITEHPGLKPVVRAGLVPAVAISTAAVNTSLAEKAAIVGSLVLVSVAVGVWAARRRSRRPICT